MSANGSEFQIAVIRKSTGEIAHTWEPSPIVMDLEEQLTARLKAKGVGLFRTSNHVAEDLVDALRELIMDLHKQVRP